ncbi:MAG: hypothetical protein KGL39_35465 [Patescibacteria group bacterium]|nr:hypothetical protein [Patescibacteria group bacterium]
MKMGVLVTMTLEGTSHYSPSHMHNTPKEPKEKPEDYDLRTWREKANTNADGIVVIPSMAIKFCLMSAASYLSEKVKGKGSKTWTSYFTSGLHVSSDLELGIHKDKLQSITIPCHSTGERKKGKRVPRTFPMILDWGGTVSIHILDETITEDIFRRVAEHAGLFIGLGRFRPEQGGFNGRFKVKNITWKKLREAA